MGVKTIPGEEYLEPLLDENAEDPFESFDNAADKDDSASYDADDENSINGGRDDDDDGPTKVTFAQKIKTGVIAIVAGAGAIASAGAIAIVPNVVIIVAAAIGIINAPAVVYKETQIMRIPILRRLNNELKNEANRLTRCVAILKNEIDELELEIERLGPVKDNLENLVVDQGANVSNLVDLVNENEEIVSATREHIRASVVQDVIHAVIMNDTDNDGLIDAREATHLALQIRLKLDVYGVDVDVKKFVQAIRLNPCLGGAIKIVKSLLPGRDDDDSDSADDSERSVSEDDSWAELEEDIYDMFYVNREAEQRRGSVLGAQVSRLFQESSEEIDEKIFPVDDISKSAASQTRPNVLAPSLANRRRPNKALQMLGDEALTYFNEERLFVNPIIRRLSSLSRARVKKRGNRMSLRRAPNESSMMRFDSNDKHHPEYHVPGRRLRMRMKKKVANVKDW